MGIMKTLPLICLIITTAAAPAAALAQQTKPEPRRGATTIYRHVTPEGRIVYSDRIQKGATVDHTITVEPVIKGNLWSTEAGSRPVAKDAERVPIKRVLSFPPFSKRKTIDEATSDVIRAEMFLDDAKKRQAEGIQPLSGERTVTAFGASQAGNGYDARQRTLAREVARAEERLRRANEVRDSLR